MPLFAHRSRNARLRMIFRFPHDDFVTVRHLWPLNSVEITPDIGRQISSMTFIHLQIMPAVVMSTSTALAMSLDSVTVFEGLENNVYPLPCLSRAKRLCVRDATLPTTIVLDSLEALDFTSWHNMRFNPSLTYCQMPLLRRLVLRGMGHYFGVGDEGPISLPLLQSLVIEECHPLIISRFGPMEVPVLHSITIENVQPVQDIPQQQDQGQPGGVARTQQSIRSMLRRMSAQLQSLTLGLPDPEAIINSISYDDGPYASQLPSSLKTLELRVLVLAEPKIGQDAQAVARLQKLLEPRIVSRSTMNTPTPVSGAPTSRTQILHSVKLSRRLVGIHGEWYTTHAGHFETVDDIPPKLK
ncbi:hypothetical protein DL93DRAFT_1693264 [Clavulina sp. PMI_390]|nr:hypothetical protein DL93DRAFT_1693264 [Clavulina sp. PMI_390]